LGGWVNGGGTLIVTADIFPLAAYESFTSPFGITGYTAVSSSGLGTVVPAHPITDGVTHFEYLTDSAYLDFNAEGLLLGVNLLGDRYMTVFEPSTGFTSGGRILVFGDHNMFADSYIGQADNTRLAENTIDWAATVPEPTSAHLLLFGAGMLVASRALRRRAT